MALARALAPEPRVLLLDEPFGALDARVRAELRDWLRRLHDEVHVTSLFVTHDQQKAFEVADQVVVLNAGRVEQVGPPQELFERPANPFVAQFLGQVNVLPLSAAFRAPSLKNGPAPLSGNAVARDQVVYVRPHDMDFARRPNGSTCWNATVERSTALGGCFRLDLALGDRSRVHIVIPNDRYKSMELCQGEQVYLSARVATPIGSNGNHVHTWDL